MRTRRTGCEGRRRECGESGCPLSERCRDELAYGRRKDAKETGCNSPVRSKGELEYRSDYRSGSEAVKNGKLRKVK